MSRPRQFDLIIFDWDGTLFDSTSIIVRSIQAAVRDTGGAVPSDQAAAYVIGLDLARALALVAPDVPLDKHTELGAHYRRHYLARQGDISLFHGVRPLLADLRARHHWLAVATGKSRHGLNEVLRVAALREMFDATRTADETAGKPDPRMLRELMHEFGAQPERTLMIGDTTHDLRMALSAGCASVGVSYGAHASETFGPLAPRFIAHSTGELHRWLLDNA